MGDFNLGREPILQLVTRLEVALLRTEIGSGLDHLAPFNRTAGGFSGGHASDLALAVRPSLASFCRLHAGRLCAHVGLLCEAGHV